MRETSGESLLVVTADTAVDFSNPAALFHEHLSDAKQPYDAAVSYASVALEGLNVAANGQEFDAAMACVLDPNVGRALHQIDEVSRPDTAPRVIGQQYAATIAGEVLNFAERADNYRAGIESWAARRKVFNRESGVRNFDLLVMTGAMKKLFSTEVFIARSEGRLHSSPRALVAADGVSVIRTEKYLRG